MFATPCSWHSPPPVAAPASEAPGPATHSTAALRAAHTTIPERRTSMLVPPSSRYAAPDLTDEIGVRDGQLVCQYWLSYEHGRLHPAFGGDWSPRRMVASPIHDGIKRVPDAGRHAPVWARSLRPRALPAGAAAHVSELLGEGPAHEALHVYLVPHAELLEPASDAERNPCGELHQLLVVERNDFHHSITLLQSSPGAVNHGAGGRAGRDVIRDPNATRKRH